MITEGNPPSGAESAPTGAASLTGRDILVLSPTPTWPLDAGNRKRIHRICSDLRGRGARVHFVYYPFEWWFTCVPQSHLDAMAAQWDSFHLAPVTRPLQAPPAGSHHTIDEWWDPAIESLLHWLLQRGRYDAFIVNYAYLSKALELAPPGTLRILDTHDRFTGRKEILAQMGLGPEYFYTTAEEEQKALMRADLVWAIKSEEASAFRTLCERPVITMPHRDEPVAMPTRQTDDDDDIVIGMVGARNSLNRRSAMDFIQGALPLLRRRLAPVRIRFGGGMCADLEHLDPLPAGVELAGRFENPEDFYSGVDAIVVPMAHSTGLKIKAVEAFSLGLPVIAHRHAVEGIPVSHPFHQCDSMAQLAECCLALATNRSLLEELRLATQSTYSRLAAQMQLAMDQTVAHVAQRYTLVLAVAPEFMDADSAYGQHVLETIDYLKYLGSIVLYIDRPLKGGFVSWSHRLNYRANELKIVFSPAAAATMGLTADRRKGPPFPVFHSVETMQALLARLPRRLLWLADLPSELQTRSIDPAATSGAYVRLDALRLLDRWDDATLAAAVAHGPGIVSIGLADASNDPAVASASRVGGRCVPFWREARGGAWTPWQPAAMQGREVWITVAPDAPLPALAWAQALRVLEQELPPLRLLFPNRSALAQARALLDDHADLVGDTVQNAIQKLISRSHRPRLVLDVAARRAEFAVLEESVQRLGLSWLAAWRSGSGGSLDVLTAGAGPAVSLGGLMTQIAETLAQDPAFHDTTSQVTFANDAGWQWVWKSVSLRKSLMI